MSVRYKFKNDKNDSTLLIDGFHISVRDLKRGIVEAKKLGRVTDFDLIVKESNTEEIYDNDEDQIPKNSSVVVFRKPLEKNQKKVWYEEEKVLNNSAGTDSTKALFKSSMTSKDMSEDDKINQMMSDSGDYYNQKNWVRLHGRTAYAGQKVPPNYKCNRCNQSGHFIYDCPQGKYNKHTEIKRTTGIPRTFLQSATAETPGAKINPQGLYMVNQREQAAYSETKVDRPIWDKEDQGPLTREAVEKTMAVPDDLQCPVCRELIKDAVLCPESACEMCDECARESLIREENTNSECPVCQSPNISPDDLIPSRKTRLAVQKFRNSQQLATATTAVPENNDIKKPKSIINQIIENKMPSLPDIPGITVPKDEFDVILASKSISPLPTRSPLAMVSPKPELKPEDLFPLTEEEKEALTPRASSLTPTQTPTPAGSPVGGPATEDENSQPPTTTTTGHKTLLPTPDVSEILSQPPPGYDPAQVPPGVQPGGLVLDPTLQVAMIPGGAMLPATIPSYLPPTSMPQVMPGGYMGIRPDDPLMAFQNYLAKKDDRGRHHRDQSRHYGGGDRHYRDRRPAYDHYGYTSRHRSRSPPPHPRRSRTPPRRRYARSPPAGYRDASPQPHKIERRAPPPPRGPRTPPMSPSRRSKTMTPPPGEDGTPPPPPGEDHDRQTPLNDENEDTNGDGKKIQQIAITSRKCNS